MIAVRLFLVVALAFNAHAGEDLKLAYELSDCLRSVILKGIPSLQIPSHNPFKFNHKMSWHGDVGIASATVKLTNLVWYGIPFWNISIEQLSEDSDSSAEFKYSLTWDRFVLTSEYTLETDVVLIPGKISGDLNITLDNNSWDGVVLFNKPGFDDKEGIDELFLQWNLTEADFNFTGLGLFNEPVSQTMGSLFKTFFQSGAMENFLGMALQERLNTWFAHNERIDAILEFCKENGTVSQ